MNISVPDITINSCIDVVSPKIITDEKYINLNSIHSVDILHIAEPVTKQDKDEYYSIGEVENQNFSWCCCQDLTY